MMDDIAWAAVYLASEEATFMTGQVISPNGEWYIARSDLTQYYKGGGGGDSLRRYSSSG